MTKHSLDYTDRKKGIYKEYLEPLLKEINDQGLSADGIIKSCIARFQIEVADSYSSFRPIVQPGAFLKTLKNETTQDEWNKLPIPWNFAKILRDNIALRNAYIKLGHYYIFEANDFNRTMIREIIFDMLSPLPEFRPEKLDTSVINFSHEKIISSLLRDESSKSDSVRLPKEVNHLILNYLDPETILSYRSVSKETYNHQKAIQDRPKNIFYMTGKKVKITRKRGFLEGDYDICLRESILNAELLKAARGFRKDHPAKIFPCLLDAIEYAHSQQRGGHIMDDQSNGFIPAIMMVSYIGEPSALEFRDESLTLNKGITSTAYSDNERKIAISYATVPVNAVLPLSAVCLYEGSDIASYRILKKLDHINPKKVFSENVSATEAQRNYSSFIESIDALQHKAEDLIKSGYFDEGEELKKFKNNMLLRFGAFEQEMTGSSPKNKAEILNTFQNDCNKAFKDVSKHLDNHHSARYLVAEVILSVLSLGVYLLAMGINKLVNNRFSFFRPDSIIVIETAEQKCGDYLNMVKINYLRDGFH